AKGSDIVSRKINPLGDSDVISVTVIATAADMAVKAANKLPEVYLGLNRKALKDDARQSRDFFEKQLEKSAEKLKKTEETLRNFKENNQITDLHTESQQKVTSLVNLEGKLHVTKTERDATFSRIRNLESQLTSEEKEVVISKIISENPVVVDLKKKLVMLEVEQSRLTQNYSGRHPQVLEINAQIRQIQDKLKDAAIEIVSSQTLQQNPLRRLLLEQLAILHADKMAIDAQIDYLESAIAAEKQSLSTLPEDEMALARLVRDNDLAEQLYSVLEEKYQDFRVTEQTKKVAGRIVEYAKEAQNFSGRKKTTSIVLSVMIALALALGIVFSMEYMDEAVYSAADVEKTLGLSVLAYIPKDPDLQQFALHAYTKPNSPVAEAFRSLRNKLRYILAERQMSTLSVTSSSVAEGKTLVALNLAITMAQFGKRVLLIDGDLRRPKLHNYIGVENRGLTNVVMDEDDVTQFIVDTQVENLSFLPSGPLPLIESSPIIASELFESPKIASMLGMLKKLFDFIIIDTPPVLAVTDPLSIAAHCDGIVFTLDAGHTRQSYAKKAKEELDTLSTPIVGAVLNRAPSSQSYYSRYLYYYYENGAKVKHR
ncbi:MAG: polysaccharide biosynthesis tyrosine autokinase, partial [bacterium]